MQISDWQVFEKLWPLLAGLVGLWVRLEIGQALNRQHINALWARRAEERGDFAKTLQQLRDDNREMRRELREEMQALRDLFERYHQGGLQ